MSYFELNALSVVLGGSFTARVFLPEMDKMTLDDVEHQNRYRVLWLLHTDGETSLQFMKTPIEALAETYGFIAVAPDMHHAMGTDMKFGPNMEKFLCRELRGIMRHVLPLRADPQGNFIGGVGTGAYAAAKCAIKHPDLFGKAFCINGILDMESVISRAAAGEDTGIPQTVKSLDAVFGSVNGFQGSENDLFALAQCNPDVPLYLTAEEDFPYVNDTKRLSQLLGRGETTLVPPGEDFNSCQTSLRAAVKWMYA